MRHMYCLLAHQEKKMKNDQPLPMAGNTVVQANSHRGRLRQDVFLTPVLKIKPSDIVPKGKAHENK